MIDEKGRGGKEGLRTRRQAFKERGNEPFKSPSKHLIVDPSPQFNPCKSYAHLRVTRRGRFIPCPRHESTSFSSGSKIKPRTTPPIDQLHSANPTTKVSLGKLSEQGAKNLTAFLLHSPIDLNS